MTYPKTNPFQIWKDGVEFDSRSNFAEAGTKFKAAASAFFDLGSLEEDVGRAYFEYSTLMDAYERIEAGRRDISENRFDDGLICFAKSSEILRSTIHYGYLAPYASACASGEVTDMMERTDPECLQGYKNSIALFEQSKIALGFQDELHPVITAIDAYIRYCISQSLHVEGLDIRESGESESLWNEKERRSRKIREEFETLATKAEVSSQGFCYLPVKDYKRAMEGAFIVSYPDATSLSLLNIGKNNAELYSAGNLSLKGMILEPGKSKRIDSEMLGKGKIKINYRDTITSRRFVEGCLLVI